MTEQEHRRDDLLARFERIRAVDERFAEAFVVFLEELAAAAERARKAERLVEPLAAGEG